MRVSIKRVYDPPEQSDGFRVLVDRLWPRGVRKEDLRYDLWLKEVTPSVKLRKWFDHDRNKWTEFKMLYSNELTDSKALNSLVSKAQEANVTLLYAAKDRHINRALILMELLTDKLNTLDQSAIK